MAMRSLLAVMFAAAFATSALAQSPPPAPTPAPPAAVPGAPAGAPPSKRASCRAEGQGQGLRGQKLQDHVQLCVQAARTACLNDAIAKNLRGAERKAFMRSCTA
jgi:Spy/CpxP family protein refolding chaperone